VLLQHASKSCNIHRHRPPDIKVKGLDISSRDIQLIKIHTDSYPERLLAQLTAQLVSVLPVRRKLFLMYSDEFRLLKINPEATNVIYIWSS